MRTASGFYYARTYCSEGKIERAKAPSKSASRPRSPYSCQRRFPFGTGGQRGALGADRGSMGVFRSGVACG